MDALRFSLNLSRRAVKASRLAKSPLWRRGLRQGVAATIEHDGLPLLDAYGSVIDVGAHKGQFALYARERYPEARLVCFEPQARPRRKLATLLAGDGNAEVIAAAVGATAGSAMLHVSNKDDSSSLMDISSVQTAAFPGTQEVSRTQVPIVTLDGHFAASELPGPVLLKIDVQGFELAVLQGATSLLSRVDSVLVECSFAQFYEGQPLFDDVYAFLRQHGFVLRGGKLSAQRDGVWLQGDFVFRRSETLSASRTLAA